MCEMAKLGTVLKMNAWNRSVIALLGLFLTAGTAHAQTTAQGYVAWGSGRWSNAVTSGENGEIVGGGEGLILNRFGIGGEFGFAVGPSVITSFNASVHFPLHGGRRGMVPFVSGGYTVVAYETTSGGMNIGGGLVSWFSDGKGILLEFRDIIQPDYLGPEHFWAVRIGLAFRNYNDAVTERAMRGTR